jgi:hypothetical protein
VRLMAPQVGLHQRIGKQGGVAGRHARAFVHPRDERAQRPVSDANAHGRLTRA